MLHEVFIEELRGWLTINVRNSGEIVKVEKHVKKNSSY